MLTSFSLETEAGRPQKEFPPLAIAATFTAEPLEEVLSFWLEELNLPLQLRFAPYNQLFQQLLEPASLLAKNTGGVNVLLVRLEDLAGTQGPSLLREALPNRERSALECVPAGLVNALERNVRELGSAVAATAARGTASWLFLLCPPSKAALRTPLLADTLARQEERLAQAVDAVASVHLIRPVELARLYPELDYDDPQANHLGNMPYTPAGYAALATLLARKLHALTQPARKVIALDCDQTLWGGVCGEDGAAGVQLDAPRLALQQFLRAQQEAGMLLCLCSKNSEADVVEVFRRREEMPLRLEHIAAQRVNWRAKSENLRALAEELSLGLDSFIFIDDNPVECAEVQANCPAALVLELPPSPAEWPQFLAQVWAFDRLKVTREDRQRTALYQQNRQRAQLQAAAPSLADFLAGLELRIQIEPARKEHLARVSQLTLRTNQFNCTTYRRSEEQIQRLLETPNWHLLVVHVSDRFGDYGLVGAVLYQVAGRVLKVDTFLLSCRVLGKGVEHQVLARLGELAAQGGATTVEVPFRPTDRNQPAFDFLTRAGAGFRQSVNGGSLFRFPATVAASIRFAPATETNSSFMAESSTKRLAQTPPPPPTATRRQVRYSWIAQNAGSPENVLRLAQSRHPEPSLSPATAWVPPQTELQRQLCTLWQRTLRLEQVGIRNDFFELGGSSQLAVRLFAELEKLTGQKLPLVTLFKSPTIEGLAEEMERRAMTVRAPSTAS